MSSFAERDHAVSLRSSAVPAVPAAQLPPLPELLQSLAVVAIPTRTRFRGVSLREAALFEGPSGWTEFSPFLEYGDAEASAWLAAAIDFGWGADAAALREWVAVNATVPAVTADEVAGVLQRFPGCTTVKVKVAERGQSLADDVARVSEVRRLVGDDGLIRVDANAGWSVAEAEVALRALAPFGLEYAEQPCASVAGLAQLRAVCAELAQPVRIAADESVRKASDPLAVARAGAADLLVVKAQPLGGVSRALELVRAAGLPVVVSSALDTSIGIAMGVRLAAALPDGLLAGACGLGTVALLAGDVSCDSLLPVDGRLRVRRPVCDAGLLRRFAAAPDRVVWWRDRITRCYARLAAGLPE